MIGKRVLIYSLFSIFFFFTLSFSSESRKENLFSKIGIQPIRGELKARYFSLEGLKGEKIELSFFKGKVILINLWATWCGPCKEEMSSMEALYQEFKERGFVLLAISVDYEGRKVVKEFIEKHRYSFPVLLDPKGSTLDLFTIKGIPTTLVIDKRGIMIGKAVGPRNWKSEEVISLINLLIGK